MSEHFVVSVHCLNHTLSLLYLSSPAPPRQTSGGPAAFFAAIFIYLHWFRTSYNIFSGTNRSGTSNAQVRLRLGLGYQRLARIDENSGVL